MIRVRSLPEGGRRGGPAVPSIPTIRGVHHFAYAVPDLDQAVEFFTAVLGAELATRFGPLADPEGTSFADKLGVHPRTVLFSALLRFGPTLNVELHQYWAPDQRDGPPRQSDPGASHLGVWVDDVDAAARYLRAQPGVTVRTVGPGGPPELDGLTNFFFETPWGQVIEVLTAPDRLPYEQGTDVRLYRPEGPWPDRP
jgi:catechol 2,3-dioxygenase-like lactoylglutathione lyase family enzyme